MKKEWPLDPATVAELFEIVEGYRAHRQQTVTTAAVEGLRLLCNITGDWRDRLARTLKEGESLEELEVLHDVPLTVADAEALYQKACQGILWVLNLRSEQRREARRLGKAKVFTSADAQASRLRRRVSGEMTPMPERLKSKKKEPAKVAKLEKPEEREVTPQPSPPQINGRPSGAVRKRLRVEARFGAKRR